MSAVGTVRLTMAQALVRYLLAQRIYSEREGDLPLFAGVFAIFGHGNVTCLAEALEAVQDRLPTWRGQNEQSMGLAGVGFAKAKRRRQIMIATSSIGPGATNLVTAAGVAHSNRLPLLILSGDTFANRLPDPVLQQVEHFGDPGLTVNDAFKAVTRYWDRVVHPAQLMATLPQAVATMLDPADCGPAFIALPQDVQAQAFDYPNAFFEMCLHRIARPRPDRDAVEQAADVVRRASRPLVVAGGGVRYSLAERALGDFSQAHNVPVVETVAGRATLEHSHPMNCGPVGVIGSSSANALAARADVVIAVGTRLQDFTTGSWSVFENPDMALVTVNAARFDAVKHRAHPLVGDARVCLEELSAALGEWHAGAAWPEAGAEAVAAWNATVDTHCAPTNAELPSYAQVIGVVNRICDPGDLALTAAGGLPGELCKVWRARERGTFDCEFGFSCMGYEIAGGWGAKMADPSRDVIVFVGDGSYLMLNSDIYSSVLTGHKLIVIVCDNGGFAVIDRLQRFKGGASFNNLIEHCRVNEAFRVDFAAHAASMGALSETVTSLADLEQAFARAKRADRTYVICMRTHPDTWTPGDAWWDVGVPEVSERADVEKARSEHDRGKAKQRLGV